MHIDNIFSRCVGTKEIYYSHVIIIMSMNFYLDGITLQSIRCYITGDSPH